MTPSVGPRRPSAGPHRPVVGPRRSSVGPRRPAAGPGRPAVGPKPGPPPGINRQALDSARRAAKPSLIVLGCLLVALAVTGVGGIIVGHMAVPSAPGSGPSGSAAGAPAQESGRIQTVLEDVLAFADDNTVVALLVSPFNATSPADGGQIRLSWTGEDPPEALAAALTAGHTVVPDSLKIGQVRQGEGLWACDFTVQTRSGGRLTGRAEGRLANQAGGTPVVKTLLYDKVSAPSGSAAPTGASS